jgi:hypothetical protein
MNKLFLKYIFVGATILFILSGCSKKFLDQEVPGKLPESEFYKTDEDAMQAVTGIYSLIQDEYTGGWNSMMLVKTLPSDESNAGGNGPGDGVPYQQIDDFLHDAENTVISACWRRCYFSIYRSNKVINTVKQETDIRKRLVAEARALRAYNYFDLVTLWGDVPLVLDVIEPSNYTATSRSKKADVYAQIEKDLQEAIAVLPVKSAYSSGDKFRISKGTAQALLGKVYLYQQKWNEAAQQFDAVISSGQYGLEPSLGKVFSKAGEFGMESLFELSFTEKEGYDWSNFPWTGQPESNIHVQYMGPRTEYYSKAPSDSLLGGWGLSTPKAKLWQAYIAAGDVVRRKNTVMSVGELTAAGGKWNAPNLWDWEGYFSRKYGSYSTQTNTSGSAIDALNFGTNWRLLRYADVLLMAAEAYYRLGNESKARGYINQVRNRSQLADISTSGNALFQALVTERQLELAYEGVRFLDLVRWGLAEQELGSLGFKKGKHELMPIPNNDVRTAGLPQNPGY